MKVTRGQLTGLGILTALGVAYFFKDHLRKLLTKKGSLGQIVNERTRNNILTLHPEIQQHAIDMVLDLQDQGIELLIYETCRDGQKQQEVYDNGWSNALPGQSYHNYCPPVAFDAVEVINDVAQWDSPNWGVIGETGKKHGFEWGGEWISLVDKPHFQMPIFGRIATLQKDYPDLILPT